MKFLFLLLVLPLSAISGMVGPLMSEGVVKSFNEEEVTLVDDYGVSFVVPRSVVEKNHRIQQGLRVTIYSEAPKPKKRE